MNRFATYVDLLRWRAQRHPERVVFRFLRDGEEEAGTLTFGRLDERARAIAAALQARGLRGERALLLFPPGLEFVEAYFGCLYAGVAAVPVYPPRMNRTLERLRAVVADAGAAAVLAAGEASALLGPGAGAADGLRALRWVTPADAGDPAAWTDPGARAADVAFLQYTSGSTSRPKGVRVTHGNLLENQAMMRDAFGHAEGVAVAGWLPMYHDMGLIGDVLHPVFMGGSCVLMSPTAFLQRPARWLRAVARWGAETSGGPDFAFGLCADRVTDEEKEGLDLSGWRVAFCGAEPVRARTLERFAAAFAECGFRREALYPCYGLAEATLFVTGGRRGEPPAVRAFDAGALERGRALPRPAGAPGAAPLVGCGHPWGESRVRVVHPERLAPLPEGAVGEVWVAGPHVAGGYHGLPGESDRVFGARLAGTGEGPFLRTGDLGFLDGGRLFVTGRIRDLVIVRGRNLYPQDLEAAAEAAHPALRPGGSAAFAVEGEEGERLVLVHEVRRTALRGLDPDDVARAVREAVAEGFGVRAHEVALIAPSTLPKTSSGKVQRGACRRAWLDGALERVDGAGPQAAPPAEAPGAPAPGAAAVLASGDPRLLAAYLAAAAARALGIPVSALDPDLSLPAQGLDSLSATELAGRLQGELGVPADPAGLLGGAPLRALAAEVGARLAAGERAAGEGPRAGPAPEPGEALPLSAGQRALWFLHRMAPESPAYNTAVAVRLSGPLDAALLDRALAAVVARHAALRTALDEDEPVQRLVAGAAAPLAVEDAAGWDDAALGERAADEAYRPFRLSAAPLLRARLFRRSADEHLLLLAAHHAVVDLRSLEIVADELFAAYGALRAGGEPAAPEPAPGHHDFARWQAALLAGPEGERLRARWAARLEGAPVVLELPADRPRPALPAYRGGAVAFDLGPELSAAVARTAREAGVTRFVVLLAAWTALLHRWSGEDDLLVGSPASGRTHPALAGTVGFLANPVVLRARFRDDPTFGALLRRTRDEALAALAGQAYPFERLVEELQPARDPRRSPLFQVMFALQQGGRMRAAAAAALGRSGGAERRGDLRLEAFPLAPRGAQFDLSLVMGEVEGTLAGALHFDAALFERATAGRAALHFRRLLAAALAAPDAPVAHLPLLDAAEERQVVEGFNRTAARFDRGGQLLHRLVEAQAARAPDAVAVTWEDGSLAFGELNARANRLARLLRRRGVRPETRVGVCMERGPELVVALLAVLKAGGAYVPLDPEYPGERLRRTAEDAGAGLVLAQPATAGCVPGVEALAVDADAAAGEPDADPDWPEDPDQLAYVIYTSGSTGAPKGAMNAHRGVVNRILWMRQYGPGPDAAVLQKTPFTFDVSVWEVFWPLATGARLVLARPGGHRDPAYLSALVEREAVTTLHFVPSMLRAFLEGGEPERCRSVRHVVCSGEALPPALRDRCLERMPWAQLHNLYGPTEAAVDVTHQACRRGSPTVPIGRPAANVRVHLLDGTLRPVPVGIPGELYIGGVQVGRGYLGRPELTAERFVPDPFADGPGARLYRTGDRARRMADGAVEYLGRLDGQLKVSGFRIEPGEVEAALLEHPGLREAAVAAHEAAPGERRLVAYYAGRGAAPEPPELRAWLRARLPEHLVPGAWVELEALPLTPGGKLDRRALPAPEPGRGAAGAENVPPRTPVEAALAEIWAEALGLAPERVGARDDFFALGGYSILAVRVAARVQREFGVVLPLPALFQAPTVEALARTVARLRLEAEPADRVEALLAELEAEDGAAGSLPLPLA